MKRYLTIFFLFLSLAGTAQTAAYPTVGAVASAGAYGGFLSLAFPGQDYQGRNWAGSVGIEITAAKCNQVFWPLRVDLQYMPEDYTVQPMFLCGFGYQLYPGTGFVQAGIGINVKNIVTLTGSYRLGFGRLMQAEGFYLTIGKPFQKSTY